MAVYRQLAADTGHALLQPPETVKWLHDNTELRSCVKVEVDVLGSPSLIVLMVSMDVQQHGT